MTGYNVIITGAWRSIETPQAKNTQLKERVKSLKEQVRDLTKIIEG